MTAVKKYDEDTETSLTHSEQLLQVIEIVLVWSCCIILFVPKRFTLGLFIKKIYPFVVVGWLVGWLVGSFSWAPPRAVCFLEKKKINIVF